MASRPSQLSSRWTFGAASAIALAGVLGIGVAACQSGDGGDGDDEAERSEDEMSEPPREADVVRVPERAEAAADDADDDEPGGAAGEANDQSEAEIPSEGASEVPASGDTQTPVVAAQTFSACWTDSGPYSDCESIFVTVTQATPGRCIQLTIDNCGTYGRQGLGADTPATWRLAGGSVGAAASPCELGVFYSGSTSVADATGSVSWDETTPRPSALELELTLEPTGVAEPIALATPEPLQIAECEE
jgi:hypothetical protein